MTIIILLVVIYDDKFADSAKKLTLGDGAAVSASPPIRATAADFVAGREAGLSIKPLIARNGQRYGANGDRDRRVFDERWRVRPLSNFLVFLAGCRPISYRSLAP